MVEMIRVHPCRIGGYELPQPAPSMSASSISVQFLLNPVQSRN
jgi:hypothetical protein